MGQFAAAAIRSGGWAPSRLRRHPFSLGYGVVLPSSLAMVPPIASVCSTRPPVSVLVRAPAELAGAVFLGGMGAAPSRLALRLASRDPCSADFPALLPTCFHGGVQNPARLPFPVTAPARALRWRYGNVRPLRIGYACRPRLSPRLTLGGLASPRKPWACGGGVSRAALATHASILAPARSTGGRPSGFAPARDAPLPPADGSAGPPLRRRA